MLRFLFPGTLLVAGPAWAGEAPTLALVGVHQPGLDVADQEAAVAKLARVVDRAGFDAVEPADVAAALRGREDLVLADAFLARGRKLLDDGRALYHQALFDAAIPVLGDAVETLQHGMATANSSKVLWEAETLLGTVHLMRDDEAGAREAYQRAAALNPARSPSAAEYPPNVVATYQEVRDALTAAASTLQVSADEADVRVFLNGVDRGVAPLDLTGVLPGENHLVARGPTGSHAYERVAVAPRAVQPVAIEMGAPNLGDAADDDPARARQTANLYRSFGGHADVDLVLLAGTGEGSLYLQLYSPRSEAFSTPVEVAFRGGNPTDALVERMPQLLERVRPDGTFLSTQIATGAVPLDVGANRLLASLLLSPAAPAATPTPKAVNWWAVGGVGVGAAALGTIAAVALTSEKQPAWQGRIVVELP